MLIRVFTPTNVIVSRGQNFLVITFVSGHISMPITCLVVLAKCLQTECYHYYLANWDPLKPKLWFNMLHSTFYLAH